MACREGQSPLSRGEVIHFNIGTLLGAAVVARGMWHTRPIVPWAETFTEVVLSPQGDLSSWNSILFCCVPQTVVAVMVCCLQAPLVEHVADRGLPNLDLQLNVVGAGVKVSERWWAVGRGGKSVHIMACMHAHMHGACMSVFECTCEHEHAHVCLHVHILCRSRWA